MKYVWLKRWMQTSNWNLFDAVLGDGVLWCVCINLYFAAFGGKGSADPWGRPLIRKMLQGLNFEFSQMNHVIQLMASETGGETTPNFLWRVSTGSNVWKSKGKLSQSKLENWKQQQT